MTLDLLQLQPAWLDPQCPREGRYVLGPLLGKGGMGEVVEAWDVVLCRTVALKILRNMEPTALIRFMHEAQIQARVAHPNICRVYDVDSSEGTVKIAMHLVRGPNLEQACRDLSQEAVIILMAQVAEAIHAAHNLKLIHRDLKPSNILLEPAASGGWTPFICDFGLAMVMDEPALTHSHNVMGTPAYMAPEQFQGARNQIGPATDIYALGGTLHFALLGRPPQSVLHRKGLDFSTPDPDRPRGSKQTLPKDLRAILRKCLDPDPAQRYPSAAALAEDLWKFRKGEPLLLSPRNPLLRLWPKTSRLLKTTRTGTGILIVAGLLMGWLAQGLYQGRIAQDRLDLYRLFAQESADLETQILLERTLPLHDLRPGLGQVRARLEGLRATMAARGSAAQGPGHLALARVHLLLGDTRTAQQSAQRAWDNGLRDAGVANILARCIGRSAFEDAADPDAPNEDGRAAALRVEALLAHGQPLEASADDYPRALVAFLRKDYGAAADSARASSKIRPWRSESACLEALSLCAKAGQHLDTGDLPGAEAACGQAMAAAQQFLAVGHSDTAAHHAFFLAARLLVSIQADRGALDRAGLEGLQRQCERALLLDPGNPELQEDWLGLQFLLIQHLAEQEQNPDQALNSALVFLNTRLRDPLPPGLRNVRRLIHWQAAERSFAQGGDPAPALAEALKGADHTPLLKRDYLAQILNFKARVEAAQGIDPRLTVASALTRCPAPEQASWLRQESAGEAWLIRGQWEASHGTDASASLAQAEVLSERALRANPASSSAHALNGLVRMLALKTAPHNGPMLRLVAQERLRTATALKPQGRLQRQLRQTLASQ